MLTIASIDLSNTLDYAKQRKIVTIFKHIATNHTDALITR